MNAKFKSENNDNIRNYQIIVNKIKDLLIAGKLAPGDKLLSERKLAEELNVSRTSVREAFKVLNSLGIVEIKPKGGTYIKEVSLKTVIEPLAIMIHQDRENIINLMEARIILETAAAKLAAKRATKTDLYKIREDALEVYDSIQNKEPADQADINFHIHVVDASHNSILSDLITIISTLMKKYYIPYRHMLLNKGKSGLVYAQQHLEIYEAIKNKEEEKAGEIMYQHLIKAQKEIEKLIENSME